MDNRTKYNGQKQSVKDHNTKYKRPQHKVKWTQSKHKVYWTVTQNIMDCNTNYNGRQAKYN